MSDRHFSNTPTSWKSLLPKGKPRNNVLRDFMNSTAEMGPITCCRFPGVCRDNTQ